MTHRERTRLTSQRHTGTNLIADLKLAASKMSLVNRRAFQAEIAIKYCQGCSRLTERMFGWGRNSVELGLHEKRTGMICYGAHALYGGNLLWETRYPEAAAVLWRLADAHSQQDPSFRTTQCYTRLTAKAALQYLQDQGIAEDSLPSPSSMAAILNRNGYRLRPVTKSKVKKSPANGCHL